MRIEGTFYIYPEDEKEIDSTLDFFNEKLKDVKVSLKNKHLYNEEGFVLSEELISDMKKWAEEKKCHLLISWNSDDISQSGFDFYNYKTKFSSSAKGDLTTKELSFVDFLISCDMKKFIEREIL